MIRIIELIRGHTLVRVDENSPIIIKRVMNTGTHGVIVPIVNSKADTEVAVAAIKYPAIGTRSVDLDMAQKCGFGFEEYKK
jgi:2-dehydro-3-deoxyglucarate aldolase